MLFHKFIPLSSLIGVLLCSACLKSTIEYPGEYKDPELPVNANLNLLTQMYVEEGRPKIVDSDWTVAVVVRADDASGNFYKEIIVEDSTAGIALELNANSLFTRFPVGRKLYLKLKGLYLANYYGTYQLGGNPVPDNGGQLQVSALSPVAINEHIIPGNFPATMPSLHLRPDQWGTVSTEWCNRLVAIEDVELGDPYTDLFFADPASATSIRLQHCAGQEIFLRSSHLANFSFAHTPFGKGTVTAIYSIYKGQAQLYIRDTTDLLMGHQRCDGSVWEEPKSISLRQLSSWYKGKDTILGNYSVLVKVSSRAMSNNFSEGSIVVQDSTAGIVVYFGHTLNPLPDMGDSLSILLSGSILTRYNGALEVKNIKASKLKVWDRNRRIDPILVDIATLTAQFSIFESRLVMVEHAVLSGGGNYGGSRTLTDKSGSIIVYTSSLADFATTPLPTISKTVQGIATPYNGTPELKIRDPAIDVY